MQREGVGSHSAEKGKPRCPKSFQCLILLCSSLHHQMQPFLPCLSPLPTSPQPTGLCEEEDLSLSGLFYPLMLVASPVMSPLPPALPIQPPLGMASPCRARGAIGVAGVLSSLLDSPLALWAFCSCLREHRRFFLATGQPMQELALAAGWLHFQSRNSLPGAQAASGTAPLPFHGLESSGHLG